MNIQLRQNEIIEALKNFITHQGINLTGKSVAIDFTAGRKTTGITADVTITDDAEYVAKVPLHLEAPVIPITHAVAQVIREEPEPERPEPLPVEEEPVPTVTKTTSLFG